MLVLCWSWLVLITVVTGRHMAKRVDRLRQPWCQPRCFTSRYGTIGMGKSDFQSTLVNDIDLSGELSFNWVEMHWNFRLKLSF